MKEMDKNADGKVSFDEYSAVEYAHVQQDEKGMASKYITHNAFYV